MARIRTVLLCLLLLVLVVVVPWLWNGRIDWPNAILHKWMASRKTVDYDFVATMEGTKDQHIFIVRIKKVNPRPAKLISPLPVQVDFTLRNDASGKTLRGVPGEWKYAEEVAALSLAERRRDMAAVSGNVRLITKEVPPGVYTVEPLAVIIESGPDRLSGPREYCGGVAVPAGNSVTVTVKK